MKYILTEEEYKELLEKPKREINIWKALLADMCQIVAEAEYGCIRSNSAPYCDNCPVELRCTYEHKSFSNIERNMGNETNRI